MPQFGAGMGCGQVAYEETLQEVSPLNGLDLTRPAYRVPRPLLPILLIVLRENLNPGPDVMKTGDGSRQTGDDEECIEQSATDGSERCEQSETDDNDLQQG